MTSYGSATNYNEIKISVNLILRQIKNKGVINHTNHSMCSSEQTYIINYL